MFYSVVCEFTRSLCLSEQQKQQFMWRRLLSNSRLGHFSTRDPHPYCSFRPFCSSTCRYTVYLALPSLHHLWYHSTWSSLLSPLGLTFPLTIQNCRVAPNLPSLGPYDFHVAENTDGIAEFDNKNGINCKTWNIVKLAKLWM